MARTFLAALGIMAIVAAPMSAQAAEQDGFYIGAAAGQSSSTWDFGGGEVDFSGQRAGLFLGYGLMMERIYLGLEGGYGFSGIRARDESFQPTRGIVDQHDFSISPRIGYLVKPGLVLFGSAGYQAVQLSGRTGMGSPHGPLVGREHLDGLKIGIGVEAALTPNIFMRGEYTHTRYDVSEHHEGRGPGNRSAATLGLGYRF